MNADEKPQTTFRDYPWRLSYRTSTLTPDGKPLNILRDFYLPALRRAVAYDRVAGYFRSTSLAAASQGFSAFVANQGKARFIVGADLAPEDVRTILEHYQKLADGIAAGTDLLEEILDQELGDPAEWPEAVKNGVQLLAYLLAQGHLEIKVAFRVNAQTGQPLPFDSVEDGYVHMKWGIFRDREGNRLYITGSLNESKQALTLNAENIDVHCDWRSETDRLRVEEAEQEFERLWADENPSLKVLTLPEAVKQRLIKVAEGVRRPVEIDGTSDIPLQVAPPSPLEWLRFALIKDGPRLPGGRFVGMETAPVKPWPHQEVVARRVIATWPFSYLLCDEVGLGKTIEAGLIIRSLYLSGLIKRVLIAPPASLTQQWQREMATKFLLPFARTTGGTQPVHEYIMPFEYKESSGSLFSPNLNIVSTGLLTRQDREADLVGTAPFDLTLVDEAHYARRQNPTQGTRVAPKFGRLYRILEQHIRPKSACLLLATATPMQLDPIEAFDLMALTKRVGAFQYDPSLSQHYYDILGRLVHGGQVSQAEWEFLRRAILAIKEEDPHHFHYLQSVVVDPTIRLAMRIWLERGQPPTGRDLRGVLRLIFAAAPLSRVMLRHNRALLEIYRDQGQLEENLPERCILSLPRITFTPQEQLCYDQLETYCRELAAQVRAGGNRTQQIAILGFYLSFLRLRFASSLFAIRQTLRRRRERVRATLKDLLAKGEEVSVTDLEDLLEEGDDDTPLVQTLLENRRPEDLEWEYKYLTEMLQPLEDLSGPSSKMQTLLRVLDDRRFSGTNRIRQTVIFTRFYDTLTDIVDRLRRVEGRMLIGTFSGQGGQYTDTRNWRLTGADREDIKRRFLRGEIDVLVCTDAAAEGLNLQTADFLINFDLPWNPMKVEQRIGRIDRIGQKNERIFVLNLCYVGSAEEIVYGRLLRRLADVGAIVGTQQISLLPVTREEFQELAENKLSEKVLEQRAIERIELFKRQAMSREIPAQDLYYIYTR
ncbi:MAG: DEAD/DEAH box helicase family protein, partial [Deltaproteobacteria bacterium]|nr:DEAD/DEAH box helicase family protein [Deltaproteobacteria bacterium]